MLSWSSILIAIIAAALVVVILAQLLPKRFLGNRYFKRLLWEHRVDWRILPQACIHEFVEDALKYAELVSSVPPSPESPKAYFNLEFERMLRIHAFVAAALLSGKKRSEISGLETPKIEEAIAAALLSGKKGAAIWKLGAKKIRESITQEAIAAALLRKRVGIWDFETPKAIAGDVKSGKEWEAQETILRRHGVLQ